VEIPKFEGEMFTSVQNNPDYDIFNFDVTSEFNEDYPEGYIISQNPQSGRQQALTESGVNVDIVVSSGTEPQTYMPDLYNKDYREAKIILENLDMGLNIEIDSRYDDSITENYVVQQIPSANQPLVEGGTVYITYSLGPEIKYTTVPKVTGMPQADAVNLLYGANLAYRIEYVDSDVTVDYVIAQSYSPNEEVEEKTVIVLTVSNGSKDSSSSGNTENEDSGSEDAGLGIFG